MKTKLTLAAVNGGAFNCMPAREIELENESILTNDVVLPWENHPHGMRLWVIGNEYGAVCAVWANHEQDALDEMVDSDLGQAFLIDEKDYEVMSQDEQDECARLGNAGEPCNLDYAWIQPVDLAKLPPETLCRFAEARGACVDNLDKI